MRYLCQQADRTRQGYLGPGVCSGLKARFPGKVACQGVGGNYHAQLLPNETPTGTTQLALGEGVNDLKAAKQKCKNPIIVAGGYR